MFGLASVERLKVSAKVSELDINQLREGQAVEISGDGFEGTTLEGVIAALGGQALPGMAQGGSPQFEVTVSVAPLDPRQLQKIRLGMSAKLTVTTYRNEQAIVVPPEAIRHEGDRLFVDFRQAPGASVMAQQVKIGRSTPEGVEVSSCSRVSFACRPRPTDSWQPNFGLAGSLRELPILVGMPRHGAFLPDADVDRGIRIPSRRRFVRPPRYSPIFFGGATPFFR